MENREDIQILLFNKITDQLPSHISLVDEVSEVLEISTDSAYRRIRGEKQISIHEVWKLCNTYKFSFDDLKGTSINTITFRSNLLDEQTFSFTSYFKALLKNFQFFGQNENAKIRFILNELNLLQIMQVPELLAFKLFFWQKSNLGFPEFKDQIFSSDSLNEDIKRLASEISALYIKIKTIELTTEETLNSYLKQIVFYNEAGYFETKEDAKKLCEKLLELTNHLKKQAEFGFKFQFGKYPTGEEGNFSLYHNDIILVDNTILVKTGNNEISYITNNAINLLFTFNGSFYNYNYHWSKNLIQKSSLISGIAEKERSRYFIKLDKKIQQVIDQLE